MIVRGLWSKFRFAVLASLFSAALMFGFVKFISSALRQDRSSNSTPVCLPPYTKENDRNHLIQIEICTDYCKMLYGPSSVVNAGVIRNENEDCYCVVRPGRDN